LIAHWQFYVIKARNLGKCFVSVKGIYFQANIQGVPVTWINPHEYTQHMPKDVDYRTMLTFLEFYETLLKFTLFKLYHNMGLKYPPVSGDSEFESTGRLMAIRAASLDAAAGKEGEEEGEEEEDDQPVSKKSKQDTTDKTAKEAAKRVSQVRKELAAMKGDEEEDDEEEEEEEDERLSSKLSRAEVNRQLEAALVSACNDGSSAFSEGSIAAGVAVKEGEELPLFHGLCFFLSRESQ
jgi:pescadillo